MRSRDQAEAAAPAPGARKRLAIITTVWKYLSHAQHMGDRFLVGYPIEGTWRKPPIDVVSLYVDQKPEDDQSEERAQSFGFKIYPTIAEALRCGGDKLAVDAVLIIGEHGEYPRNEKGQVLYPRFEFFRQAVDVFEADGRAVPIFNDKHLSYSFEKAKTMVELSRKLGFPLLAGSSLPVTWRLPAVDLPLGAVVEDALMVGVGGSDAMDYHALEAMQCVLERRKGGETGVKRVQMIEGDAVWQAADEGRWSRKLLEAALSRSDSLQGLTVEDGRPQNLAQGDEIKRIVKKPAAYFIDYADGTKATLLMLNGALNDYNLAVKVKDRPDILSTQFMLPTPPNVAYSANLMNYASRMFETGRAAYPAERTMLVCGILESCLDSRMNGQTPLDTPKLAVRYEPPRESLFARR